MSTWTREWSWQEAVSSGTVGAQLCVTIPSGATLLRLRFRIHLTGTTSAMAAAITSARQVLAVGACTVFRVSGSSTPLDPTTPNLGQTPPVSRWLYWDVLPVRLAASDGTTRIRHWQCETSLELASSKGMVKANVPAGEQVDVYLCWRLAEPWDSSGSALVSSASETLINV